MKEMFLNVWTPKGESWEVGRGGGGGMNLETGMDM